MMELKKYWIAECGFRHGQVIPFEWRFETREEAEKAREEFKKKFNNIGIYTSVYMIMDF